MTILRGWSLDLGPHTGEKISYKIDYFSFYGTICYLKPHGEVLTLHLQKDDELAIDQKILEAKGRTHVMSLTFTAWQNWRNMRTIFEKFKMKPRFSINISLNGK